MTWENAPSKEMERKKRRPEKKGLAILSRLKEWEWERNSYGVKIRSWRGGVGREG